MHPKLYGLTLDNLELVNTEKPEDNVWDVLCFQTDEQLKDWISKVQEMFKCGM